MINRKQLFVLLTLMGMLAISVTAGISRAAEGEGYKLDLTEKFARELMQQERYAESASYLQDALDKMKPGTPRFPLLLLLAESQLYNGDVDDAGLTIREAFILAGSEKDSSRVWRLKGWAKVLEDEAAGRAANLAALDSSRTAAVGKAARTAGQAKPEEIRITNSFFESDLRMVLSDLSMEAGVPILFGANLEGLVTYDAADQPLSEVLNAILLPLGYTYREINGKYFVGSIRPDDPAFPLLSETEVVPLANILAAEAVMSVSDFFTPYVKPSHTGNAVIVTAPPTIIERVRDDLRAMDKAPLQISIDVIVAEISHEGALQLGIDWAASNRDPNHARELSSNASAHNGTPIIGDPALQFDLTDLGVDVGGTIVDVTASLKALLESGEARIRANPRITTMNGRPAAIKLVRDEYFIVQTSTSQAFAYNSLQSISSGIQLNITPFVAEDQSMITMYVFPQVGDVVGEGNEGLPRINTRSAETTVRVADGETFTIGGLSLEIQDNTERRIPLLGSIPFLGYLFRYTSHSIRESEVVIFVTPNIVAG